MMQWENYYQQWAMPWGFLPVVVGGIFFFLIIGWSLAWKGVALWKAARSGQKGWFVALMLINTLGVLEILYIYVFSKRREDSK